MFGPHNYSPTLYPFSPSINLLFGDRSALIPDPGIFGLSSSAEFVENNPVSHEENISTSDDVITNIARNALESTPPLFLHPPIDALPAVTNIPFETILIPFQSIRPFNSCAGQTIPFIHPSPVTNENRSSEISNASFYQNLAQKTSIPKDKKPKDLRFVPYNPNTACRQNRNRWNTFTKYPRSVIENQRNLSGPSNNLSFEDCEQSQLPIPSKNENPRDRRLEDFFNQPPEI